MFEIGSTLREARKRRELALQDAERATRIRARHLAALEEERFDELPAEVYAKAFLRTYAEFLGLDGELYVAELNARIEASTPPPPPPPERRLSLPSFDLRAAVVAGAGVALVVAGLLAWRFAGGAEERPPPAESPRPPAVTTTTKAEGGSRHRRPVLAHLVMTAAGGTCWLSVRIASRDGAVLYEGLLQEGDTLRFARRRLWIRIGAPWNLEVRLNGRLVTGLPADTGNILVTRAGVTLAY
jgi:cytoskeleton protein RodZ